MLIWCPFPDEGEARRVAGTLLDEGLIACANIVPGMISLYVWQGKRGEARKSQCWPRPTLRWARLRLPDWNNCIPTNPLRLSAGIQMRLPLPHAIGWAA